MSDTHLSVNPKPHHLASELLHLPGSYQGPQKALTPPFAVVGVGQAAAAGRLLETLVGRTLTREGTQIVLQSPDALGTARDYAGLAEVSGAAVARAGVQHTGQDNSALNFLAPAGVGATYHLAQYAAYATGHANEAQQAETLLANLAQRCAPDQTEDNPARELAWSLWSRTPLLLAAPEDSALVFVWQQLLARIGKSLSIPMGDEPLLVVTGAFEGQHERGDEKIALILGDETPELALVREVLESRIDEVLQVPFIDGVDGYAGNLALWYFGAWVAYYLAERHASAGSKVTPEDSRALQEVFSVLGGAERQEGGLEA